MADEKKTDGAPQDAKVEETKADAAPATEAKAEDVKVEAAAVEEAKVEATPEAEKAAETVETPKADAPPAPTEQAPAALFVSCDCLAHQTAAKALLQHVIHAQALKV